VRETIEVEDFAAAWIRFDDGLRVVLKTSWARHLDALGGTFLIGDAGGLRLGVHEVSGPAGVTLFRDEFGCMTDVAVAVAGVDNAELFRREDAAFAVAVRAGGPSPVDPIDVLVTNVVFDGMVRSAAIGGREVDLELPDVRGA
jgi:predicted dehydrogenase